MSYVDGFVIPVAKNKVKAYTKMAQWGKRVYMKEGALQYFECVGDDLKGMPGCAKFKTVVRLKANETAFFSFVIYKNKAHRNAVNKRVMKVFTEAMKKLKKPMDMPFDPKRMAYGGFKAVVEG